MSAYQNMIILASVDWFPVLQPPVMTSYIDYDAWVKQRSALSRKDAWLMHWKPWRKLYCVNEERFRSGWRHESGMSVMQHSLILSLRWKPDHHPNLQPGSIAKKLINAICNRCCHCHQHQTMLWLCPESYFITHIAHRWPKSILYFHKRLILIIFII